MDREQAAEWQALQRQAKATLSEGHPSPLGAALIFRLGVFPAFSAATCVEVFQLKAATAAYHLIHSRWDFEADFAKFRTPLERLKHPLQLQPTIRTYTCVPSADFIMPLLQTLRVTHLPLWAAPQGIGLDGTAYQLTLGGGQANVCYRWQEPPPPAWAVLGQLAHTVLEQVANIKNTG